MSLKEMLQELVSKDGSDLYLAVGAVPAINKDGHLEALKAGAGVRVDPQMAEEYAEYVMTPDQRREFDKSREMNLAFMEPDAGRFRVNVYWQRGSIALVFRRVKMEIPTMRELGLPAVLRDISLQDRGIVLVTGATGSGKSTTMASMINYRNHVRTGHIVTIEDPIEFLYKHRRSIVSQRELGIDTISFEDALKNTLRQAPQVICIGELRDAGTVQFALHAAETGHLVFATLHSTDATITIERILNFYPGGLRTQVLHDIAHNVRAIVSQRLVPKLGGGRCVAVELLVNTPRMIDLIVRGDMSAIRQALSLENQDGITSMDKSLFKLLKRKAVSEEDALAAAHSANDLQLKMRGIGIEAGSSWEDVGDEWERIGEDYELPAAPSGAKRPHLKDEEGYYNTPSLSSVSVPLPTSFGSGPGSRPIAPGAQSHPAPPPPRSLAPSGGVAHSPNAAPAQRQPAAVQQVTPIQQALQRQAAVHQQSAPAPQTVQKQSFPAPQGTPLPQQQGQQQGQQQQQISGVRRPRIPPPDMD